MFRYTGIFWICSPCLLLVVHASALLSTTPFLLVEPAAGWLMIHDSMKLVSVSWKFVVVGGTRLSCISLCLKTSKLNCESALTISLQWDHINRWDVKQTQKVIESGSRLQVPFERTNRLQVSAAIVCGFWIKQVICLNFCNLHSHVSDVTSPSLNLESFLAMSKFSCAMWDATVQNRLSCLYFHCWNWIGVVFRYFISREWGSEVDWQMSKTTY